MWFPRQQGNRKSKSRFQARLFWVCSRLAWCYWDVCPIFYWDACWRRSRPPAFELNLLVSEDGRSPDCSRRDRDNILIADYCGKVGYYAPKISQFQAGPAKAKRLK